MTDLEKKELIQNIEVIRKNAIKDLRAKHSEIENRVNDLINRYDDMLEELEIDPDEIIEEIVGDMNAVFDVYMNSHFDDSEREDRKKEDRSSALQELHDMLTTI